MFFRNFPNMDPFMNMDPFGSARRMHQNALMGMHNNSNNNIRNNNNNDPFQMMLSNPFSMMDSMMGNMNRMMGNMVCLFRGKKTTNFILLSLILNKGSNG